MSLKEIISSHDNFFFDLDGVVWECESLLPGVSDLLNTLVQHNKSIYYVTNNAIHSRASFLKLFQRLQIPAEIDKIVCASYSCANYLKSKYPAGSKIFVIGVSGLCQEIAHSGFEVISSTEMEEVKLGTSQLGNLNIEDNIKAVVVGFTPRLNFYMVSYALNCLNQGAELITGNYDCCDKFGKYNIPGSACTIEFLRYSHSCGFTNLGKPERVVIDSIIERDGLVRERSVVFGDKMATDIKLGKNAGIHTALVLTGVEKTGTYERCDFQPEYVLDNLLLTS